MSDQETIRTNPEVVKTAKSSSARVSEPDGSAASRMLALPGLLLLAAFAVWGSPFLLDYLNSGDQLPPLLQSVDPQLFPGDTVVEAMGRLKSGFYLALAATMRALNVSPQQIEPLLRALSRSTVPLSVDELAQQWTPACISESLAAAASKQRLPPRRYSSAGGGNLGTLLDDLVELAVLYPTEDRKRYNMPDIFRVGFGIKRKGGVRPPR